MTPPDARRPGEPSFHEAARGFRQEVWDDELATHAEERAREWLAEDLGHEADWTSVGLIPATASASLQVVARDAGVMAGLPLAEVICRLVDEELVFTPRVAEGARVVAGEVVASLAGPVRDVLVAERTLLNALGRMSGVATAVRRFVDEVEGTGCDIYDTRKTVPGWRRLDKYAVRVGGGCNHRGGLFDAILIKDNHLAELAAEGCGPDEAVRRARAFVRATFPRERAEAMVVEIEVDSLEQLTSVLAAEPDVVLLDNMTPAALAAAVAMRNAAAPHVVLEASGGISLENVRVAAESGVDRVSTGWPTHDAPWLDLGLDWGGGLC